MSRLWEKGEVGTNSDVIVNIIHRRRCKNLGGGGANVSILVPATCCEQYAHTLCIYLQ